MEERTQLTVMLENRPGALSRVVSALAKAGVNIQAITINDGVHHGVLKLVPSPSGSARKALSKAGIPFSEQTVYALPLADRRGALAEACGMLAAQDINIDFIYGSSCGCAEEGCDCECNAVLILSLHDAEKAAALLGGTKSERKQKNKKGKKDKKEKKDKKPKKEKKEKNEKKGRKETAKESTKHSSRPAG